MKKLCLLTCACLLLALVLVGCNKQPAEDEHMHTYADVWSSDADGHWYAATCEHADEKANASAHVDAENDGVCDICAWGSDHTHTYEEKWSYDDVNHWHASSCGHSVSSALAAHEDKDNDDLCDVCSRSGGCEHPIAADAWLFDAEGHWHGATCKHSVKLEAAEHEDADNDGVCDVCGWYDQSHTHTYKTDYAFDDAKHWFEADCGHTLKDGEQAHEDDNNDGACDICPWNDGCAHEYSVLWSVDGTNHWHAVTCSHSIAPKDQEAHTDADGDQACDVCGYVDHDHTFDLDTWIFDKKTHWHAANCGCTMKTDEAAHADANNDGACDICEWNDGCEHPQDSVWSYDSTHHWHGVTCTHTIAPTDKGLHADPDLDGSCNACGWSDPDHTHTFENQLSTGLNTHYYAATCAHTGARKDEQPHLDDDGDDLCDVCGGVTSLEVLVDMATSDESAAQVNSGTVQNNSIYHFEDGDFVSTENISYEFGDGYLHTDDGVYQRWFTRKNDGTVFGVRMVDDMYEAEESSGDCMLGYHFNGHFLYYSVEGYGVEALLYNLHQFAQENATGLDGYFDAIKDAYYIHFLYDNGVGSLFDVSVELKLSADYVIKSMRLCSVVYGSFTQGEDGNVYPTPGAIPEYEYEVIIKQNIGARTAVNQNGPDKFLFASYDFADENGNLYGDVIELAPGEMINLYFTNVNPATASAKLDALNVSVDASSSQVYQYLSWMGDYICVKGIAAGTYTMTVTSTNLTKQITIKVGTPELQSLTPQIYYKDYTGLYTSTVSNTYTVYKGQMLHFGAMANPTAANAGFTASASSGTLGTATIEYGAQQITTSTFCADSVGTYTVTLTSTEKPSVTATLTVNVVEAPSVGDILNGTYMADIYDFNVSNYSVTDILVTFEPVFAGADNGTVTVVRNGNETEVMTYSYENGEIVLTHVSGDDLGYTLALNDQNSVTVGWQYDGAEREQIMLDYTYTNRVYAEIWVSAEERIGNDMYAYTFVFGDQGYVHDAANSSYPDLLSSVNDQTGEITVTFLGNVAGTELEGIERITFDPETNTVALVLSDRTVILTPDRG